MKVKAKVTDIAGTRAKEFKNAEVKPAGCLKTKMGCDKTSHFNYNSEKGLVKCMFDCKDGCTSPFPRKVKTKAVKQKKAKKVTSDKLGSGSILAGDEDLDKSSKGHDGLVKKVKTKTRKGSKVKSIQQEFEIEPIKPKKLKHKAKETEEVKGKAKHSDKFKKAKGFL